MPYMDVDEGPGGRPQPAVASLGPFLPFALSETEQSIPERFQKTVQSDPHKTALEVDGEAMTYEELDRASNRVANALLQLLGHTAEPVALLPSFGMQQVVAVLGTLKAGKWCVALDRSFPASRLEFMIADTGARSCLSGRDNLSLASGLSNWPGGLFDLDELSPNYETTPPCGPVPPDGPAFIVYTAGSTGKPKGALYTHRSSLHGTLRRTNMMRITPRDRMPNVYPYGTSIWLINSFLPLLNGATLLPFDLKSRGAGRMATWLEEERVTTCHTVPPAFRALMGALEEEQGFPSIRLFLLGSDAIRMSDVALFQRHFSAGCRLISTLACTETNLCRYHLFDRSSPTDGPVPLAFSADGVTTVILDDDGNGLRPGATGQIAFRSRYFARGYWKRPELTSAAFLPDREDPLSRLYLTGDHGYLTEEGTLIHQGRRDFQIRISGFKVVPGEVETHVSQFPGVREAAIAAREDPSGERRLVAYVVTGTAGNVRYDQLRRFLSAILPAYMVPSAYVEMESLPLTPLGKVDRRALPTPDWGNPSPATTYVPPRTPLEETVARIWQEVLELERVGATDDFFDLGGNSLRAVGVISRIRNDLGRDVSLSELLRSPTVEGQAALLFESLLGAKDDGEGR